MESFAKPEQQLVQALAVLEPEQACLLAYSGGRDSSVLLHALVHLRPDIRLRAAYVDHGMHAASAQWAIHCRQQCAQLKVPYLDIKLEAPPSGNLEAWAREQRYAQLQAALSPSEVLLTGHHQRDQAETLLLNLLRGSGPQGLAAMPRQRAIGEHFLLRPLLPLHPDILQAYAQAQGLEYLEDPSNASRQFDRNFLRHEVLRPLEQRFPQALGQFARSAALIAAELAANAPLPQLASLPMSQFSGQDRAHNNRLLRAWLRGQGLPPPRFRMLDELWRQLLHSRNDAEVLLQWPGAELRRYRDQLYAMTPLPAEQPLRWSDLPRSGSRAWPWGGQVQWHWPAVGDWQIGCQQGGERLRLRGQGRRLKTLFQQAGVPPWQRSRMPLVSCNGQCLAVGDRWRSDEGPQFEFVWLS